MAWLEIDYDDYPSIRRSWQLLAICIVVLLCAITAYCAKSRGTFWAGVVGIIAGATTLDVIPLNQTRVNGTAEGVFMFHLHEAFSRLLMFTAIGMLVAMSLRVRWRYGRWLPLSKVNGEVDEQPTPEATQPH